MVNSIKWFYTSPDNLTTVQVECAKLYCAALHDTDPGPVAGRGQARAQDTGGAAQARGRLQLRRRKCAWTEC